MINRDRINLFNGFTLDLARGCVVRGGETVHLRPQSYEVLKYLVENKGRLISKDKLIEEVWHGRAVTDGSLGKCVEEVREALGPDATRYVRNVRGRGYIFDLGIEEAEVGKEFSTRSERIDIVRVLVEEEENDAGPTAIAESPSSISASSPRRILIPVLVIAALLITVTTIPIGIYWLKSRVESRRSEIATVPFRKMNISRLTNSGKIAHAAISPDGKYVAHVTEDSEGDSLWIGNIAAPANVRIAGPATAEYPWVTFAPDGDSVYYLALDKDQGETTLYRVPVLGGPSTKAAHDVGPIGFSPDKRQITFVRMYREESHLIVADADGRNERTLATRRQPEVFQMWWNAPAWSPDGKTIACPVRLNDERGQFETIIGVNVADGKQTSLTSKRWNYVGQPAWLADQSGLLLAASDSATAPEQVWQVALKSGQATRVTHDLDDYHDLSLTADSTRLAAVQDHSVSSIWVAPEADASRAKQIASEVGLIEEVAWTLDGRIVYLSNAGNNAEVWVMSGDGSNPKQLTSGARASRGLNVSPDGRYIFFASDRAGHFNIWRVDSNGGNLKQVTSGDGEFYPSCTPDSQWVVFQRWELEPTLWKVRTDGGEPVQLTETRVLRPNVSPNGEVIAYHYLDPDLEKSRWSIGVVSSKGGRRLQRFDFPPTVSQPRFVRWSPDGQSIAYANRPGGFSDIWLQPLDGSPPKQLTKFKAERISAFDWSRDGHSFVFVRRVETRDVVLIEQQK